MQFLQSFGRKIRIIGIVVVLASMLGILLFSFIPNRRRSQDLRSRASEGDGGNASDADLERVKNNFFLPSILGFQTTLLTGDATANYSFEIPDGPGGLKPVLGLFYSSSLTADWGKGFGLGGKANSQYIAQASQVGFGWNMTGVGSVTKARVKSSADAGGDDHDTFVLNLGGASYKLIKTANGWQTSPRGFLKIEHDNSSCQLNKTPTSDIDIWRVTDKNGTIFVFGDDVTVVGNVCNFGANSSSATAMRYRKNPDYSKNPDSQSSTSDYIYEPYKWMLQKVKNTHNNTVSYKYKQEFSSAYKQQQATGNGNVIKCTEGEKVEYAASVNLDSISYGASNEFGVKVNYENRPDFKSLENIPPNQKLNCDAELYFSKLRVHSVDVKVNGKIRNSYDLSYANDGPQFTDGYNFSHSLLKKVTRKGKDGNKSLPPHIFTYEAYAGFPNVILLKTADNGQGGLISYNYEKQTGTRCRIVGACVSDGSSSRLAVISKQTKDTVIGNSYTVTYQYDKGLGIFESINRTDASIFDGYQFLGYNKVLENTNKINQSVPVKISRTAFYIHQEENNNGPNCFNPHEFYGQIKTTEILGAGGSLTAGKVLSSTKNSYISIPDKAPPCTTDVSAYQQRILPFVALGDTLSTTDGVTKETKYQYDQYANTIQESDLGYIDDPNDDRYSFSKYTYNPSKNILNTPYIKAVAFDGQGKNLVSLVETYYDNHPNLTDPPDKGDITKTVSGSKNILAKADLQNVYLAAIKKPEVDTANVLGASTDVINVYVKENSQTGLNYRGENKKIELWKLINTCANTCDSACGDKVCKKKSSPYNKNKGFASFPSGTDGATYVFSVKDLESGWSQKTCLVKNFPTNTSCTIVVIPSTGQTPTPTPAQSVPTSTPQPNQPTLPVPQFSPPPPYQIAGTTTLYEYDQWGNQTKMTNGLGQTAQTEYDTTHTQLSKVINPAPFSWTKTFEYDPVLLKPIKEVAENGAVVEIDYDNFGRITKMYGAAEPKSEGIASIKVQYVDSPVSVRVDVLKDKTGSKYASAWTFYNGLGQEIQNQKQWPNNTIQVMTRSYTSLGSLSYIVNPFLGDADKFGSLIKTVFSPDKGVSYGYDMLGRNTTTNYADSTSDQSRYSGKTTTLTDRNGSSDNKKVTTYNGQGKAVSTEESADGKIFKQQFFYDPLGKILTSVDPGNHASNYKYDMLGRFISQTNPDIGTTNYTYDSVGNKLTETDNKGQTIKFSYDQLNRVTSKLYPDGSKVAYAYDEGAKENRQKLTSVSYGGSVSHYAYDVNNLLVREERQISGNPTNFKTEFSYDPLRFIKTVKYPDDNEIVTFTRDIASNPVSISGSLGKIIDSISYSPDGQVTNIKYANATNLQQDYYPGNFRLKDWKYVSGGSSLADKTYEYDKVGNIRKIADNKDAPKTASYLYDQLYRLVGVTGAITSKYTYDIDGNLTEKNEDSLRVSSVYKPSESTAAHAPKIANGKALSYDQNGNLVDDQNTNLKISYDFEQRPIQVDNISTNTRVKFTYDGEGRRLKKEIFTNLASPALSATTYYINSYYQVEIGTGNQKKITKFYNNYAYRENGNLFFLTSDHLSSARLTTNPQGAKVSVLDYYPYGLPLPSNSNPQPANTWIGEKFDTETGLYFLNARYYSPTLGRFIQPDSLDDPSVRGNRYLYGGNSPIVRSDRSGHCEIICLVVLAVIDQLVNPETAYAGDIRDVTPQEAGQMDPYAGGVAPDGVYHKSYEERGIVSASDPTKETLLDAGVAVASDVVTTAVGKAFGVVLSPVSIGVHLLDNATGWDIPGTPAEIVEAATDGLANQQNNNAPDPNRPPPEPAPTPPTTPPDPNGTPVPTPVPPPPDPPPPDPPGPPPGCFTGNTLILMKENSYKKIKDVKVGDVILTRESETSSNLVEAKVKKTYIQTDKEYLILNGGLEVTAVHPMYVNGKWLHAGEIKLGDFLLDKTNHLIKVTSIDHKLGTFTVYNLSIQGYRTFFANDIYVHNKEAE